jgi:hypothetical protein
LPEAFAVVVALPAPLNVTVAPPPPVIVPEILNVWAIAVAVNTIPVTFAPFTIADRLVGLNVKPVLLGVTV